MTPRRKWTLFGLSVLAGACIWLFAPYITGKEHAFRAPGYYRGALIVSAVFLGAVEPRGVLLWPLGITAGQLAIFLILGSGPLMQLVLAFILVPTTIVTFAAAGIGALVVLIIRHLKASPAQKSTENGIRQ